MRNQYKVLAEKYNNIQEGIMDMFMRGNARKLIAFLKQEGFDINSDPIRNEVFATKGNIKVDVFKGGMDMVIISMPSETGKGPGGMKVVGSFSTLLEPELQQLFDTISNIAAGAYGASPNSREYQIKKDIRSRLG